MRAPRTVTCQDARSHGGLGPGDERENPRMITRSRTSIFLATVALLAPVLAIAGSTPAGASTVDTSDLTVSAMSGAPGDRIEVSSASCVEDDNTGRVLVVRLISGTAPDEVLGAAGVADE